MAKDQLLTFHSILNLGLSPNGLYLVGYAWLFGMSLWISFFGGVIAYKTLRMSSPTAVISQYILRTFPIYFVISILLSSALLARWTATHPDVITNITRPNVGDVAQVYALASVLLGQGLNYFVIGPLTSKTMFQRQKLEKEEGKSYNEQKVSAEMKSLNRRFGMLHGISSIANLGAVISLVFHGLWIGNAGVKGY